MFIEMALGKIISGAAAGLLASNIECAREAGDDWLLPISLLIRSNGPTS